MKRLAVTLNQLVLTLPVAFRLARILRSTPQAPGLAPHLYFSSLCNAYEIHSTIVDAVSLRTLHSLIWCAF